ncbi:MAG: hypothetical protein A2Z01_09480 [Betaproteobacteria bacterium RBG_16_58_11]|nr:MAG: hypothetical protein A2Z01_09480 [Betaproteobacteria bacterium RBG_16_58_11]
MPYVYFKNVRDWEEIKMKKIVMALCCFAYFLLAAPVQAVTVQATTWQVLGGSVFTSDALGTSGRPSYSAILTPGLPGQLIEGSYQSGGEIFSDVTPIEGPNPYGFVWSYGMSFFTSTPNQANAPLAAPIIDVNGMADMSSFMIGWYEITLESVGNSAIVPVTHNADGTYTISWMVYTPYDFGSGDNVPTNVTMNFAAVPIPAALWLLASGLIGLVGVARVRR